MLKNIEDKSNFIINELRMKIKTTDTDLKELFKHFDETGDNKL